jgi:hypothetical protein
VERQGFGQLTDASVMMVGPLYEPTCMTEAMQDTPELSVGLSSVDDVTARQKLC